jgi:hypothetical protein
MGRMKEHPRYNVVSCRISENMKANLFSNLVGRTVQQFVHDAIESKLNEEKEARCRRLLNLDRHNTQREE